MREPAAWCGPARKRPGAARRRTAPPVRPARARLAPAAGRIDDCEWDAPPRAGACGDARRRRVTCGVYSPCPVLGDSAGKALLLHPNFGITDCAVKCSARTGGVGREGTDRAAAGGRRGRPRAAGRRRRRPPAPRFEAPEGLTRGAETVYYNSTV